MDYTRYNQPLTEAEETTLYELSRDPDPVARLKSNYYQLRQREIFSNYEEALAADTSNDYAMRQDLQEQLMAALDQMRREYDGDVKNAIQIHLTMLGVVSWRPAA